MMKMNIDSMSAMKMTENERRVNAQVREASQVSQSVASQKLPDSLDSRGRRTTMATKETAHIVATRASRVLIRRSEAGL